MPDVDITCTDCGSSFPFTEGEQDWLTEKFGADYRPPRRCKPCRQKRKQQSASLESQDTRVDVRRRRDA